MKTMDQQHVDRVRRPEQVSLRVCVVGPDEITRRHLSAILSARGLLVSAETADPSEAGLGVDSNERIDAVIVALDCLASPEIEQLHALRARFPSVDIVVVSPELSRRSVQEAVEVGADGLVLAERVGDTLAPAVRAACAGLLVLPQEWRLRIAKPLLSQREKQVLALVTVGFSNQKIAEKLVVTESTVKSHLTSIYAKLGVRGRNEATALVLDAENGLATGILAIFEAPRVSAEALKKKALSV
jgi:DNA-binding NarL/FixJ family response regulator